MPEHLSRRQRRIADREARRAAQRAATRELAEQLAAKTTAEAKGFRPKLADTLGGVALPLTVAALFLENTYFVAGCLTLAGIVAAVPVYWHAEISRTYRILYCAGVGLVCLTLFLIIKHENLQKELAKNEGILTPSNLPRPSTSCPMNDGDFAVFAGGGAAVSPQTPAVFLMIAGEEVIAADRLDNGSIRLKTIRLYDDQNEIIARVSDNTLWVHPSARRVRPDLHTLVVYDRRDIEVLALRFLNPNSVSISGTFRRNGRVVVISDSGIKTGTITFRAPCVINSAARAAIVIN